MEKYVHETYQPTQKREIPKAWLPAEAQGLGFEWACSGVLITLKFTRMWDHRESKK